MGHRDCRAGCFSNIRRFSVIRIFGDGMTCYLKPFHIRAYLIGRAVEALLQFSFQHLL